MTLPRPQLQTKFRHLFKPGMEDLMSELQADVDTKWEKLLKMAGDI
ncbi:MAG: hypothetical protein Q7T82_15580 [Armatimonadota bacterium]|nr:hypothetical protein [Armatimonadota bacterium]